MKPQIRSADDIIVTFRHDNEPCETFLAKYDFARLFDNEGTEGNAHLNDAQDLPSLHWQNGTVGQNIGFPPYPYHGHVLYYK